MTTSDESMGDELHPAGGINGEHQPAVLIQGSLGDPRVPAWALLKWVLEARARRRASGDKAVSGNIHLLMSSQDHAGKSTSLAKSRVGRFSCGPSLGITLGGRGWIAPGGGAPASHILDPRGGV
eukprot:6590860-Pyramimonas_sp.AAC.2